MSHALTVLAALPLHHLYLDGVAVLALGVLFWRINLSGWALHANRTRAMRWRVRCHLRPGNGFASLAELAVQWSRLIAAQRGGRARPSLSWRSRMMGRPHRHALRLGRAQLGKRSFASMEENWLILSPPRKGKTGVLAEWVLKWPGAVISTSTRADVYEATSGTRYRRGPIHVFNPARVGDVPSTFGWDVVAGCQDPAEAFARADALIGPRVGGQGDMAFWQDKAAIALAALLHAAALARGADVLDIWAWCNRQGDAIAGSALAHHPAASAVLRAVFAEIQREGRSPDSVRLTMAKSLAWVAVPSVQAMVSGPMAQPFDAARFALECGTLYLIAPQGQSAAIAPLFRCFVDYAHRAATLAGSSFPAGKLDPPVLLALDEVKQVVPVPLDLWLADSAGKGVCIVAVAHGVSQLREGWGEHGAAPIWDTTSKLVLPGVQDAQALDNLSALCGLVRVGKGENVTEAPVAPPSFIRRMPRWRALVLTADLSPLVVKTRPVWKRTAYRLGLHARPPRLAATWERLAPLKGQVDPGPGTPPVPEVPAQAAPATPPYGLPALRPDGEPDNQDAYISD
jgi:type IV secretion system protein VirD4